MRSTSTPVPRWVQPCVVEALADTPVVVLNGARQVGKSTLVSRLTYPGTFEILTLDDEPTLRAARSDPRAFLDRPVDTLVIDEVQLEPRLFRAIKAEVDRDRRPGRFLLTGSSRLLSAPDMADALVGRVEIQELWPFSQDELAGEPSWVVDALFDEPRGLLRTSARTRRQLIDVVCAGGFPDPALRQPSRRAPWFASYARTSVEHVVGRRPGQERAGEIPRLLRLCAARTSQEIVLASLASELGMTARAVDGHLAQLADTFLIQLIPAWSTNLSSKVTRRPKLVMVDSGLAAHLVGATPSTLATPDGPLGPLLETFVAMELRKQLTWARVPVGLSHFRDRGGAEVDLVLERGDGRVVGVEVKATSTPRSEDFRGLRLLEDRLGDRFAYGVVLCLAPEANPFGPKLAALPLDVLWRPGR